MSRSFSSDSFLNTHTNLWILPLGLTMNQTNQSSHISQITRLNKYYVRFNAPDVFYCLIFSFFFAQISSLCSIFQNFTADTHLKIYIHFFDEFLKNNNNFFTFGMCQSFISKSNMFKDIFYSIIFVKSWHQPHLPPPPPTPCL